MMVTSGAATMSQRPMEESPYLTVGQVAHLLAVSPNTILRWIRERELPAIRTKAGYRVVRSDLQEFLAVRRTDA